LSGYHKERNVEKYNLGIFLMPADNRQRATEMARILKLCDKQFKM
jgi:hypothetical protein